MTKKQRDLLLDLIADASELARDNMGYLDENEKKSQRRYIEELDDLHHEVEKLK